MITSSRKWSRKRLSSGSSPPQQQSPQQQQQQQQQQQSTPSSGPSSTTAKDLFATIPEEPAAEAAEAAGTRAEGEAADKPVVTSEATWQEADFSFEDAPAPPSKESLTSGMGRKNLTAVVDNPEDADSEMQDADVPAAVHPGSSSKRKGRSTSQGGAKKSATPLKSPRSSSAGLKVKAAPVTKPVNKIPKPPSPPAKAAGKPAAKPPPKTITPLDKAAAPKAPPTAVTTKPPPDLSDQPLPLGGAFHMLPNALPSHPKGLDKRLFKPPYSKTLTPSNHPSEVGLPWNAHLEQLAKAPEKDLTAWGWEQFFGSVLEGNSDALAFLIHPFANLNDYIKSRHKRHAQAIASVGCQDAKNHLIDIEQHSFMLILLKVLAAKGDSMLMPPSQIELIRKHLTTHEATFPQEAQDTLDKVQFGGCDKECVSAVKTYALSAHKLLTPVNIWAIPHPTGHAAVFASPNKLSLVSTDS